MTEHPPPTARPGVRVDAPAATILHHGRRIALGPDGLQIGRVPGNDIQIASTAVSRRHARIVPAQGGHWIVDLGSRNGTVLNGERFYGESRWLANGDTVVVGGEPLRFVTGQETRFDTSMPALAATHAIRFTGERLTIGRDEGNDVVLDDPNVSRFHAEVVRAGDELEVRDLASRNGTRVDGQPARRAMLQAGSEIGVGPYRLIFDGTDFVARAEHGALRLDAEGI